MAESAGGDGIRPEHEERVGYDVGGEGRHRLVHENARAVPPRRTRLILFLLVVLGRVRCLSLGSVGREGRRVRGDRRGEKSSRPDR